MEATCHVRPPRPSTWRASSRPRSAATGFGRRSLLRGALAGAGFLGASGLLAACGSSGSSGGGGGGTEAASGTLTFGSNQSDAVPKQAYADLVTGFNDPNIKVTTNTVDHNTFQENINTYLQGQPDDVFTWFAGYRMKFFAAQGLVGDISDVWQNLNGMPEPVKAASTGDDGKQYFVPFDNYPWAIFYRPSVFQQRGYQAPKTLDELVTLSTQMQKDGLVPIAFADKDGWPAMGTFDQLNLRINGYDFHVNLMAGKEAWDSDKVKKVFDTWNRLLPFHQPDALGRTWQEAAQSLQQKKSGMYVLGMFVGQQFTKGADQDDLDFFAFPEVDSDDRDVGGRGPDRRLHDGGEPEERGRGEEVPRLPRHARRRGHLRQVRPDGDRGQHRRRHRGLQQAAEEGGRVRRRRQADLAVPRPRHAPRLRIDGDDPGAAAVHQVAERHRRAHQEHREPEEVDLHVLSGAR